MNRYKSIFIILLVFMVVLSIVCIRYDAVTADTAAGAPQSGLTLIIDAGHGGEDGGAVAPSGVYESTINISIAQKLEQIMGFCGVKTVMTRTSEDITYPDDAKTTHDRKVADQKNRLSIINRTENAVLISIHQDKFSSAQPFGAQVHFASTDGSEEFAHTVQKTLIEKINPENNRTEKRINDTIYLMNNVKCPAILIECGFLSNPAEAQLLQTEEYRLKIAAAIASGYIVSEDNLKKHYTGGLYEN